MMRPLSDPEAPLDEAAIAAFAPDAVVVATSATPLVPPIPGIDGENVVIAEDVLLGKVVVEDAPVVVWAQARCSCPTLL